MELITPSVTFEHSYRDAIQEAQQDAAPNSLIKPKKGQSFAEFVKNSIEESKGLHLPKGYVPNTELWLIDNGAFIGRVNIRHRLTPQLTQIGGHIGYWIRPSKRRMGYGKVILKLSFQYTKRLGIAKVLVTCDDTNIGSQKVIEANGGRLENSIPNGENNPKKMRYWIYL